jgi:mRNA-degrading endonuclease YafQ of YafQ-DinJ toxin-antitoxin module
LAGIQITKIAFLESFQRDFRRADRAIQMAAEKAIEGLMKNPQPKKLRVHSINGCFDPKIFKADVLGNHSWQITFHMDGTTAVLRRLGSHKLADRDK